MKKVICMAIALATTLTLAGCHKEETVEPKNNGATLNLVAQQMKYGAQPFESYYEWHDHGNGYGFCRGITFKGWEHC